MLRHEAVGIREIQIHRGWGRMGHMVAPKVGCPKMISLGTRCGASGSEKANLVNLESWAILSYLQRQLYWEFSWFFMFFCCFRLHCFKFSFRKQYRRHEWRIQHVTRYHGSQFGIGVLFSDFSGRNKDPAERRLRMEDSQRHLLKYDPGQRWTKMNKVVLGQNGQIPNPLESTKIHQVTKQKKTKNTHSPGVPCHLAVGTGESCYTCYVWKNSTQLGFPRPEMRSSWAFVRRWEFLVSFLYTFYHFLQIFSYQKFQVTAKRAREGFRWQRPGGENKGVKNQCAPANSLFLFLDLAGLHWHLKFSNLVYVALCCIMLQS